MPSILLPALLSRLQDCPVEAVESPELLVLYRQDRDFHRQLGAADCWRLLYGLAITLLDYGGRLDLEAHELALPGDLPAITLWQICDGLVCTDFQLDHLDWSEELPLHRPLSLAQIEACHAALRSRQTLDQLNTLIAAALRFIDSCPDVLAPAAAQPRRPQGWLQRLWRVLSGDALSHAETA